jgi:hypothetical protein
LVDNVYCPLSTNQGNTHYQPIKTIHIINQSRQYTLSTNQGNTHYQPILVDNVYCLDWLIMCIALKTNAGFNWNRRSDVTTFISMAAALPAENLKYLILTYQRQKLKGKETQS